jgi:transcriptional regulator with XRE-family HTH domain
LISHRIFPKSGFHFSVRCYSDAGQLMMTAAQMRAARAMLGIDQRQLAEMAGVSVPTIQRMERSSGTVRGMIESLTRVVEAFDRAGIVLIGENATSSGGGRGVRLKAPP